MEGKKIFFNGLNELRAFAALSVIFHHIELLKRGDHVSNLLESSFFHYFIERLGKNGVNLFFVLSGFLITYLLLKEKEKHQTILFKKFFLRRIFRIWPLYYLVLMISFLLIPFLANTYQIFQKSSWYLYLISNPHNYSIEAFLLYLLFLPNVALNHFEIIIPGCSQAWSVGVEEQFYILWPLLIFIFSRKKIVWIFLLIILGYIFCNLFFQPALYSRITNFISVKIIIIPIIFETVKIIPFEFMAIGAIGGYLYAYHREKIIFFSKSKYAYFLILGLIFVLLFFSITTKYFQNIILSFLFLCLILITVEDDNSVVFRNKKMMYLGKISYGIYMYHPFVMFLVFPFANTYFKDNDSTLYYNLFVYSFVFCITILLSHLSYKYFESVFIKIKDTKYKSL